jgi:FlaA1/EpsC-like NDP-sugar epimerase
MSEQAPGPGRLLLRQLRAAIGGQYIFDAIAWSVALILAAAFRYEFALQNADWAALVRLCVAAAVLQFVFGRLFFLYRGRYRIGSFHEARALAFTVASVSVVLAIPTLIFGTWLHVPRSTVLVALPITFTLISAARYLRRLIAERRAKPSTDAERTLIYGAGYMASFLVPQMLTDPTSKYLPVALLDDSPAKRNLWVHGVPVKGTRRDLVSVARREGATTLIVCIARADSHLIQDIKTDADAAGLRMLMLPLLGDVLEGRSKLGDLKDVSIEDLIGRHPVDTEVASIADYLSGKRVLVTGGGGSIGSALCREIAKFNPSELFILDRDESGLQATQLLVEGNGLLDTGSTILADIRDAEAIDLVFEECRPDVVFHAAALKHLPMLERFPEEAWKTNILGTLNVLNAAMKINVSTFVNISTDKAANPTSILGHSKRVAEKLTSWAATKTSANYLSVRFGNVIGSRGSMLPTFTTLIEAGGPLTITHPDVTRYFMTIPEACQLVVQAGAVGRPGEVLILDMGEPVRILDVAKQMIAMSGRDIEIVYTGLRTGEKLNEVLLGEHEVDSRPRHPKISHAAVRPLDPANLHREEWLARCGVIRSGSLPPATS